MTLQAKLTSVQVVEQIAVVAAHEKISKALVGDIAAEVLAHATQHGDITLVNKLLPVLTPANRSAVVLLIKECTTHQYNVKEKQFGKKDKDAEKVAFAVEQLTAFIEKYNSCLWAWYEAEKAEKIETAKFSDQAFAKMVANYLIVNGSFEGFDGIVAQAKSAAVGVQAVKDKAAAKQAALEAGGLSAKEAKAVVDAMIKDGRISAEETPVVVAE